MTPLTYKRLALFAVLASVGLGLMLWPGEPTFSQRPGPEASADGTFAPLPPVRRIAIRARDQECLDLVRERALRTPATEFTGTKIKELRVGDAVVGENPSEPFAIEEGLQPDTHTLRYPPDDVLPQGLTIQVTESVITQVSVPEEQHLLGSRYIVGSVDATDVTPALWRYLDLEMPKPDGSIAKLSVARPLWWLEQTKAKAGATIDLGLQEIGISGRARVLSLRPCTADSRSLKPGRYLVTGTIAHHNATALELTFADQSSPPLGVTANHPIYSYDRQAWVPAGDLGLQERVQTLRGTATLLARTEKPGRQTVYNLEVHRCHAYLVSQDGILAHNTGVVCPTGGVYVLRQPRTGQVMKSGRTKELARRQPELRRQYPGLDFEPKFKTNDYATQRGLEQMLHDTYKPPLDKINGIDPKNPKRQEYLDEAKDFLRRLLGGS
jgi:hypothetical protein